MILLRNVALLTLVVGCLIACMTVRPGVARADKADMNARERAVVRSIDAQRAPHGLRGLRGNAGLARPPTTTRGRCWTRTTSRTSRATAGRSTRACAASLRTGRWARRWPWSAAAAGERLASRVVSMWMNSPGHRAILLSSSFRLVGIGARAGSLGSGRACVVTADFGSRR